MSLSNETIRAYTEILKEELIPAMGCTEPIAIAYAASIVSHALGGYPEILRVGLSGNIIKNVKSVIVPSTDGMHGISSAICAGIIAKAPEKKLQVLCALNDSNRHLIREYQNSVNMEIYELESKHTFEILIEGQLNNKKVATRVAKRHTNVVSVILNDKNITSKYHVKSDDVEKEGTDRTLLNVKDICEFAETVDLTELTPILQNQICMNMAIATEGIRSDWGASIGKTLYENSCKDVKNKARSYAAAGSDARMNGCEMPVMIISGSGNQGITASVPVYIYGEHLGKSREEIYRALIVSDLITIHQKTGIGCLSAYCGAISAGCGCGCGQRCD